MNARDPRKPSFVAAVKKATGASKITNIKERANGVVICDCSITIPLKERRRKVEFRFIGRATATGDGSAEYPWQVAFCPAAV